MPARMMIHGPVCWARVLGHYSLGLYRYLHTMHMHRSYSNQRSTTSGTKHHDVKITRTLGAISFLNLNLFSAEQKYHLFVMSCTLMSEARILYGFMKRCMYHYCKLTTLCWFQCKMSDIPQRWKFLTKRYTSGHCDIERFKNMYALQNHWSRSVKGARTHAHPCIIL